MKIQTNDGRLYEGSPRLIMRECTRHKTFSETTMTIKCGDAKLVISREEIEQMYEDMNGDII